MPVPGGGTDTIRRRFAGKPLQAYEVAAVAYQAGFRGTSLRTAVAISFAENGSHDPDATHTNTDGSIDRGLWQINSVHAQYSESEMFNPRSNAAAAYAVSSSGRDFSPWTTYKTGAYVAQLPAASKAIHDMNAKGGAQAVAGNVGRSHGGFGIDIPNPVSAVTGVAGQVIEAVTPYVKRALQIIGGLILLLLGLIFIAKDLGMSPPIPVPL